MLWSSDEVGKNNNDNNHNEKHDERRRVMEFTNLEPLQETEERRRRIEEELENKERFVKFGDDLWNLRMKMEQYSSKLVAAITEGKESQEHSVREKLRDAESRDPELVYMLELAEQQRLEKEGRHEEAEKHKERALAARSCLPQFNLDGLWVGKYGSHGYEMVNISYAGDTLIATKITGDKNVPKGEITFQADLNPLLKYKNAKASYDYNDDDTKMDSKSNFEDLPPIMLTDKAAKKWGTRQLPRYAGLGKVAEEGFVNQQWMDGQLIIIGDEYFSFAWIPIENQIFFGRPSAELALKMLRDRGMSTLQTAGLQAFAEPPSLDDDMQTQKNFVTRCFEKTEEVHEEAGAADEFGVDSILGSSNNQFGCIWTGMEADECYFE